jgi:hypothetical protein
MIARKNAFGTPAAQFGPMMTALLIWMGLSAIATLSIVSALALGARRHIPVITPDAGAESLILLNRGTASGGSALGHSFAR